MSSFMFDAIVKSHRSTFITREYYVSIILRVCHTTCDGLGGQINELGLCEALYYTEVRTVPAPSYNRLFHNCWAWKCVALLWGVWVSKASHTTKEEPS